MDKVKTILQDNRGSLMVELCAVCIILISFFLFMGEMVFFIRDSIHIQQAAREGAREASLISSSPRFSDPTSLGRARAEDCLNQYFGNSATGYVELKRSNGSFVCQVQYQHKVFCMPQISKTVSGTAIYPDFSD